VNEPLTIVERITLAEERIAIHETYEPRIRALERQVGLPQGGDQAVAEAVDDLLDSLD
jgi:hypothetical protein